MKDARLIKRTYSILLIEQTGFRKGFSCIKNIYTIQQIMEKQREFNRPAYLLFIDYVNAFDTVGKSKLWEILI